MSDANIIYQKLVGSIGSVYEPSGFERADIKIDKLNINIEGYNVIGDEHVLGDLFALLVQYEIPNVPNFRLDVKKGGLLFNAPQGGRLTRRNIRVRSGTNLRGSSSGKPLFGVYWNFHKLQSFDNQLTKFRGTVDFKLNPTRFFRHLIANMSLVRQNPNVDFDLDFTRLLSLRFPNIVSGEMTLDQNDNCLLGTGWHRYNDRFSEVAKDYQRLCFDLFDHLLVSANVVNPEIGYDIETKKYNLDLIEFYWERASRNAIRDVRWFSNSLMRYGRVNKQFQYGTREGRRASRTGSGRMENSPCILFPLRNGATLKVYAKTDFRIRFELIFDIKKCTDLIGGEKTTNDLDVLFQWVSTLENIAVETMVEWRERLYIEPTPTIDYTQVENFIEKIFACDLSSAEKKHLFRTLIFNGCYVQQNDPRMRTALDRLVRNGVLKITSRGVRSVTNAYFPATNFIRDNFLNLDAPDIQN